MRTGGIGVAIARTIGFVVFLFLPVPVYPTMASCIALWRADDGPPWWAMVLVTVPYAFVLVVGWAILVGFAALCSGIDDCGDEGPMSAGN